MGSGESSEKVFNRGEDYEKVFVAGVAFLLYYHPDFEEFPDFLKDFVVSEVAKLDS